MKQSVNSYLQRIKDFGLCFFIRYHIIGRRKGKRFKQQVILDYIKKDLKEAGIDSGSGINKIESRDIQPIWVCWWQGEELMPPIVKACFYSIQEHANGHPINLITESNVSEYISIPNSIKDKLQKGIITITHFSDYIRYAIISKHGGLWVDATMYITADFPDMFPQLFTLKQRCTDDSFVSDYRWTGFFIGGEGSAFIFEKVAKYLSYYWENYVALIDYYLMDYIIAALYEIDEKCREMIDNVPESNPNLHLLQPLLNSKYNPEEMKKLTSETSYFKLSWKEKYNSYTQDGHKTFFAQINSDAS